MAVAEFRILGPLELVGAQGAIRLPRAKPRALLAILLLRANTVVSTDALIELLWREKPPASARKLLQVYISQLRQALGEGTRIETRPPGYRLSLLPGELDSARFERLVDEGRVALAAGNPARSRRALTQALELWRGPALEEFTYADFAHADAERLEELRLAAREERIEADLALAHHEQLIPELRALTEQFPTRERLWRQLMLALYRTGRQGEALACFGAARRVLIDHLGLEPGDELRQLQRAVLRHDPALAPIKPLKPVATNLPAQLSPLIGREQELRELVELLRGEVRLVTLAGAGGSGKTRLAIEVARRLAPDFANGAFLVELAALREAALVPLSFAAALGVEPTPGQSPQAALRRLSGQELLVVVDNIEHLPEAGSFLIELLQTAGDLTLLVTSRSVLHLSGERVYPVGPLEPEAAVQLFLARAQAAQPTFAPDAAGAALVSEICERLDRLPLAIELAAARARTLSLDALHSRISRRLQILTGGPRDLSARQQTLRATIDWSYDLLPPEQRAVLGKLAVFAGAFTLEAAEEVADCDLAAVEALHDQNLLQQLEDGRLRLLETVREYAGERLRESGEYDHTRRMHARYVLELARTANVTIEAEGPMRHDLVIRDRDNIRAALDWAEEADETELGLELAALLENYWVTNNPLEGRIRLGRLLQRAPDAPVRLRAHALRVFASTGIMLGENEDALRDLEASLLEYRRIDDPHGIAIVLQRLAVEELRRNHVQRARKLAEESLRLSRTITFAKGEAVALGVVATVEMKEENDDLALALLEQSAALCGQIGFPWWHVRALTLLSELLLRQNRLAESQACMQQTLPLLEQMGDRPGTILALAQLAHIAARDGSAERAGKLWGALEAEEARNPHGRWKAIRAEYEHRVLIAGPEFQFARASGWRLELRQGVEYARASDHLTTLPGVSDPGNSDDGDAGRASRSHA